MSTNKKLSNSYSTGNRGAHFEAHVQALFVVLMLTGGRAPCFPRWPIAKVKLQGKIDGYEIDDLVVFVENPTNKEQRKLLGQIKSSIAITQGDTPFKDVIQAAWNDFNNPKVFTKNKDVIALITGSLSATDQRNVQWLLEHARDTESVDEFCRHVHGTNFSPSKSATKLEVIKYHLKEANGGKKVVRDDLYNFLNHFYILSYDLGSEHGTSLSLLHSHICQFQPHDPQFVWGRIVDIVQNRNQNAGTITPENLPEDLLDAFKPKLIKEISDEIKAVKIKPTTDWTQHPDATYFALAGMIGTWDERTQCDIDIISELLGISYNEWQIKAQEILHIPDSLLSLKNGIWRVVDRAELWNRLGSRIFDQNLSTFKSLALSTLTELDPAFELPTEERYSASIRGKVMNCSHIMRKGIAEGLAIMSIMPEAFKNCSLGKIEKTCSSIVHEILYDANWVQWGSLNRLLPILAEVAPDEFLAAVENALNVTPCPFDELFDQEGNSVTGRNYLTGLLWALEGLAWDEQYLVRVCTVLGELANHDPGGQWGNRPSTSLVTILLPWFPQTLASVEKRKVAVQTLLNECPEVGWNLIIQLLPNQHQNSSGSHKPNWRMKITDNLENEVTPEEYQQQVSIYAELAVVAADHDIDRLSELIDHFDHLPQREIDQLIKILTSSPVSAFPEEKRLRLWNRLIRFTNKSRWIYDAEPTSSEHLIDRVERVTEHLAPTSAFHLYQHLFTDLDSDLYDEIGDWEEQINKLDARREKALSEVLRENGIDGVIQFAESVDSPNQVGRALGVIADEQIEKALLPQLLGTTNHKRKALVSGFIRRRYHNKNWEWCNRIDKSSWTLAQKGQFLTCLPFTKKIWDGASHWLQEDDGEYWTRINVNPYQADSDLTIAIEKLIEYSRPYAATNCLAAMLHTKQVIDVDQCVRVLIAATSSSESTFHLDGYHVVKLIEFLQTNPAVNEDELLRIEWEYLPLLNQRRGAAPHLIERRLASDPEFFSEVIQLIYRSKLEDQPLKKHTKESEAIATKAWRLLREWRTPPGTQKDGTFSEESFTEWLQRVKFLSTESGHLGATLSHIGEVLIHAPADPDGLWMNRSVAEALNDRAADKLRDGYRIGVYNSRGFHWVDPTGKPEKDLAKIFRSRAEEIENAGYQRFTVTLRDLANRYDQEAEQIIIDHKRDDE